MIKNSKCLVTGAAGFIGSHLVDSLIKGGSEVVALDDLSGGFISNVNEKATFVEGSITESHIIDTLFEQHKFDYVFHLAAYAAEGLSHFIRSYNYRNNLLGSINLINASIKHKIKCFVFTSSIAVYGKNQLPMSEDMVPEPEDPYGIAKYAVELDLKAAHELFGLNYIVFRPHNVYGERQNVGDKYRNVIGIFMNNLLLDKDLIIFGDGEQTRAFSHISDVSPIIARSIINPKAYNQVFNIGADQPHSVNELAQVIMKEMGIKGNIVHAEARNEVVFAYSDHTKIKTYFDLKTKAVPLDLGIRQMVNWVKEHGAKTTSKFENIEIEENLPSSWK